jgi:hypothetical protein
MSNNLTDIFSPTPECPSIDELAKPDHRQHLAACGYCSSQLALLRNFESGEPASDESEAVAAIVSRLRKDSPAASESRWSRITRPKVLAPAVIALAAASLVLTVYVNSRTSSLDIPAEDVMRTSRLVAVAPVGQIAQQPSQLRWDPVPGAAKYNIRMLEVDRTELWSASSDSPAVNIPESVRTRIVPLKTLLWEVSAVDSAGKLLAASGIQRFVMTN